MNFDTVHYARLLQQACPVHTFLTTKCGRVGCTCTSALRLVLCFMSGWILREWLDPCILHCSQHVWKITKRLCTMASSPCLTIHGHISSGPAALRTLSCLIIASTYGFLFLDCSLPGLLFVLFSRPPPPSPTRVMVGFVPH